MGWDRTSVRVDLVAALTEQPVATATFATPDGEIAFMAEPVECDGGRTLRLRGTHVQGVGAAGRNAVGPGNLRTLADVVLEGMGYDELIVEGAVRTSGARPGRTPRVLRFKRRAVDRARGGA